ncbi:gamma-secretase-activating protein isoform X1 [Lepisosteus oculatus]|uniref:gamma-secretase-activating protein isoform X1 n=1 Tax=Lepisosteus oculatus TaxID=7918 RepID=UPI00370FE0C4
MTQLVEDVLIALLSLTDCSIDQSKDVISIILRKYGASGSDRGLSSRITEAGVKVVNIERDGSILYAWKGTSGTTNIGKYDPQIKQNKLLYTFDKEVCVSSTSVNKEETLLAVSVVQKAKRDGHREPLRPDSKCITLLIEIHPLNNTKVLKAVDCRIRVQFLYPDVEKNRVHESHLLLMSEDSYVELFHISLATEEGYRVVIQNPNRLPKEKVAEDFTWAQWNVDTQRLFYLTVKEKSLLRCVQFYSDRIYETLLELSLDLPASPFASVRFINFGYDHYKDEEEADGSLNLVVFMSKAGSMCVCYCQPVCTGEDVAYTIAFVHRGCSKTYRVAMERAAPPQRTDLVLISLDYYIAVCLPGHFLHFINIRQPDLLCHSLFLTGEDARLCSLGPDSTILSLPEAMLLEVQSGTLFKATISSSLLLEFLCRSRLDCHRLAALHCAVTYLTPETDVELQIIHWLCENVMSFDSFDQIQEFILASLYRRSRQQSFILDRVLPYSSLSHWEEGVPGVTCSTELLLEPVFRGKAKNLKGYWEELHCNIDSIKYFEAVPNPRYKPALITRDWNRLWAEMNSDEKKPTSYLRNIQENTKKVLSIVETWHLDKRVVPLFQEEDFQQRALIGLMVDKLRDHINRHLNRLGKKRIDMLVVNYVAQVLELTRHILETVWIKYNLSSNVLSVKERGSSSEWAVFHLMSRILEAAKSQCLPLPPGFNSLLTVLGMRCLPQHTFLQYIDHGILQLTEPFVTRLLKDLDNSDKNEQMKFSIMKRLPESLDQKIYQLWDHPISSACIARNYVRNLFEKLGKKQGSSLRQRDHTFFQTEFLPLNYLTKTLSDVEDKALNPFEEQENVDAKFVEEIALKQTSVLLGFEET